MADLRMPDLNRVMLAGRLTHDPELKYLPSGTAVCKLRLAVSRQYKTQDGERREDTVFINVDVWDRQGEYVGNNLSKGRPVLVEGSLKSDDWEDRQGQKRTTISVRAQRVQQLDWADRSDAPQPARPPSRQVEEPQPEDDIPF